MASGSLARHRIRHRVYSRFASSGGSRMTRRMTAAETRQRIIEATAALIEERGLVDITVTSVMERAGVSRTAFYRQFPDPYAVVAVILETVGRELLEHSGAWLNDPDSVGSPDVIYPNLLGYARAYEPHGRLLGAITDAAGLDERVYAIWRGVLEAFVEAQAAAIARDQAAGAVRAELDPRLTAYALALMGERVSSDLLGRHRSGDPEDYARILAPIWHAVLFGDTSSSRRDSP